MVLNAKWNAMYSCVRIGHAVEYAEWIVRHVYSATYGSCKRLGDAHSDLSVGHNSIGYSSDNHRSPAADLSPCFACFR